MEKNRRYTVMPFPQGFDGNVLKLNIVLIPRNMNPFADVATGLIAPNPITVEAFADFQPQFEAAIVNGFDEFPFDGLNGTKSPIPSPLRTNSATTKRQVLEAIAKDFEGRITLTPANPSNPAAAEDKAEEAGDTVKKYLPETYRSAFNFTSPRHENAKTDDSYQCVMRGVQKPVVTSPKMDVSWGELYAHILRQPLLAKACGMVYSTELTIEETWFIKGGYLFINVINEDYVTVENESLDDIIDGPFIKRYAARIPKLTAGKKRSVFAPILFPVLHRKKGLLVDPEPQNAPWDQIFPEVNEYNDGFAKIVHANQPVSHNLLQERQDGLHPQHESGIRLGWDDEQILIWYIRQLMENPNEPGTKKRVDAPLGVFGYCIDVKDDLVGANWESLNLVSCTHEYILHEQSIGNAAGEKLELPFQVYPTQPDGIAGSAYWLPMYYANWLGKSMVLKNSEAAEIYQNDDAHAARNKTGKPKDSAPKKDVPVKQLFEEVKTQASLFYGHPYHFRIRLMDISGGSPDIRTDETALNPAASPNTTVDFKRYVAPSTLRIEKPLDYEQNKVEYFNESAATGEFSAPSINVKRPLLGYPAVVLTNKYQKSGQDPIQLLKAASEALKGKSAFGIADPDVTKVQVRVEVETLRMDNMKSKKGNENYATLYVTTRSFPIEFDAVKTIPVKFIDVPVLNFENASNPFFIPALQGEDLDGMKEIVLPTTRKIRLSLRAVCDDQDAYFGFTSTEEQPLENDLDTRFGGVSQLLFYKESVDEKDLLTLKENVPPVQALYLQPDAPFVNNGNIFTFFLQREMSNVQPDIVQRLAAQLGVECRGLTLVSKKGHRVVFGCSNRIKHTLAPDHSSITFASKADLINHWVGALVYKMNRDWTWNALEDVSFKISRYKKFLHDEDELAEDLNYTEVFNEYSYAGDIEIKHTVSFEALQPDNFGIINRGETTLVFIDGIEPNSGAARNAAKDLKFPDELMVSYGITPKFKKDHGSDEDKKMQEAEQLQLPTTVNPVQIPKLVSAGIAFSPYRAADKYESTEARKKFLWLEFEEPVNDPNDTIFCRMLAYSPDQLLSNNHPELLIAPEESPLAIDPEFTRKITPGQSDDMTGINAMQAMEKATDSDVHYILPIPPGMHAESPELFGFFTYEFRIGHGHWSERDYNLWSTAQARFGRPLRVTGIQHPAPNLLCTVNRNDKMLWVNAPYAQAVVNGKNVTSKPVRTQLWCLLYTQVKQADGKAYRNILLDEKLMLLQKEKLFAAALEKPGAYSLFRQKLTTDIMHSDINKTSLSATKKAVLRAGAIKAIEKDKQPYALVVWNNDEILQTLNLLGLPDDGPLSVLVVEVFGNITNFKEHITDLEDTYTRSKLSSNFSSHGLGEEHNNTFNSAVNEAASVQHKMMSTQDYGPLSSGLGNYRILRTSPLTEVPFVCCTLCDS